MHNRFDFSHINFPDQLIKRLDEVLKTYQELADCDPHKLRNLIPEEEIWRFFVEASVQEKGRGLKQSKYFKEVLPNQSFAFNPLNYTVKDYIEKIEKISFNECEEKSPFMKFLNSERWHLNEDECENLTLSDLLAMDKAWLPFEQNEPNYFLSLYCAFQEIYLTHTFDIKRFHKLAMQGVKGTNYEKEAGPIGEFSTNQVGSFWLTPEQATAKGITEFLDNGDSYLSIELVISENDWVVGSLKINRDSLTIIKKYAEELKARDLGKLFYEDQFLSLLTSHDNREFSNQIKSDESIKKIIVALGETEDHEAAGKYLYQLMEKMPANMQMKFCSFQDYPTDEEVIETLNDKIKSAFDHFSKFMKQAVKPIEKVYVINAYVEECERIHPFDDANCRTICMLGLMILCKEAGFPIPLLNDANQFDLCDREFLLSAVIQGMENTLKLAAQPQGEKCLFNVKTLDILHFLQSKSYLEEKLNYFNEVVAIEERNRMRSPRSTPKKSISVSICKQSIGC